MDRIKMLLMVFLGTLANNRGAVEGDGDEEEEGSEEEAEEGEEGDEAEEEGDEEEGDDEESEEGDDEEEAQGSKRSKYIPRDRFDRVNEKAKKVERLLELGVLVENAQGDIVINPKKAVPDGEEAAAPKGDYYFEEKDVDKDSWPLVQKINKGFKKFDGLANRMAYTLIQLQAENAILRDYPEFLQKESPLRKKAMHILKDDPEFKKKYSSDPERGYWAVKRASELLAGKRTPAAKKKPSSKFIIGKGDGTGGGKRKVVDISQMSEEQLDELEKKEFENSGASGKGGR